MGDPNNSSFNTQSFQQENPQFQSEYEKKVINITNFWLPSSYTNLNSVKKRSLFGTIELYKIE